MLDVTKLSKDEREFVTRIINRLDSGDVKTVGTELLAEFMKGLTTDCGSTSVRLSHRKTLWEKIASLISLRLMRCRDCLLHYYRPLLFPVRKVPFDRQEWTPTEDNVNGCITSRRTG